MNVKKYIIFDLDGTLANIDERRKISAKPDGKIDWDIFFNPSNIKLDKPNDPVIKMAQVLAESGHTIVIFSGRSQGTILTTKHWLNKHRVPYHMLMMRPESQMYVPDNDLKRQWLNDVFPDKSKIVAVFDDRNKVVDMWRSEGLPCFQVAPGNF